ncbi:unnamed protein product [Caenorhabditis brenneri]
MAPRRRKQLTMEKCVVCSNMTSEFNYKVTSCNTCKMVFRRAIRSKNPIAPCTCSTSKKGCRICKFYACVRAGMDIKSLIILPKLLEQLSSLNENRLHIFFNFQMTQDLGIEEIMNRGFVKKRENDVVFTAHDWVSMEVYSTIQFMKGLNVVNLLTTQDLMYFTKNAYFKSALFFISVRSYTEKWECMTFPGHLDVFPEEMSKSAYNPVLLNRIRCLLISKFIEFNVTQDELLLLIAIIFCDPCPEDLSSDAVNVISQFRSIYTSALFNICCQKSNKAGAIRYMNLICISNILTKTMVDLNQAVELFRLWQPDLPLRKLVSDSF